MKKRFWLGLVLLFLSLTPWTWAENDPSWVRVGLAVHQNDLQVTLPESVMLYSENGSRSPLEAGVYHLSPTTNGIALGEFALLGGEIRIVPVNNHGVLGYNGRFYRGEFVVLKRDGGLTLVNRLLIEE
ncbi:MAG TPA: hypothetical protein VHR47_09515, partial [Bacillota bacterium]|nr:hypothetical protein [Bacillota bacterium]